MPPAPDPAFSRAGAYLEMIDRLIAVGAGIIEDLGCDPAEPPGFDDALERAIAFERVSRAICRSILVAGAIGRGGRPQIAPQRAGSAGFEAIRTLCRDLGRSDDDRRAFPDDLFQDDPSVGDD